MKNKKTIETKFVEPKKSNILFGHESLKKEILDSFTKNTAAHSWLITGPQGIGKATAIYNIVQEIFLSGISEDYKKQAIISQISTGSYGNLISIKKKEDSKEISVEDIRKIKDFLYLSSSDSKYKIVIIDAADYLNINSSNALLKILEEPPKDSYIFLINHAEARVLNTIKSRCRIIRLKPLEEKEATEILKKLDSRIDDISIKKLLYLTSNSPGQALELYLCDIFGLYKDFLEILKQDMLVEITQVNKFADRLNTLPKDLGWQVFTIIINHIVSKIIKTLSNTICYEIIAAEQALINQLSKQQTIDQWFIIWDKQQELLKETIKSNLDSKQVILLLVNMLKGNSNV